MKRRQTFVAYDRSSHFWGIYGEAELHLLRSLILNLGLRDDRYNYADAKINPRAALIYNPSQSTRLKFLYGTAFRPPELFGNVLRRHGQRIGAAAEARNLCAAAS